MADNPYNVDIPDSVYLSIADYVLEDELKSFADKGCTPDNDDLIRDIDQLLTAADLDVAYWSIERRFKSVAAVTVGDNQHVSVPTFTIILKYQDDVTREGIDKRDGNWSSGWAKTGFIRDGLVNIFESFDLGDEFICPKMLIFAGQARDTLVLDRLGRLSKPLFYQALRDVVPNVQPTHLFSSSGPACVVVFKTEADYEIVQTKVTEIQQRFADILKEADKYQFCRDYRIEFIRLHKEMPDLQLYYWSRED